MIKQIDFSLVRWRHAICRLALLLLLTSANHVMGQTGEPTSSDIGALKKLAFEELFNIEITTVSRRPERLVDAASAIQVITSEEIRRSGASSLPEALRLATNLQVAQIDSSQWAISARGFQSSQSNKLLVLIDGRSVYTPLFSGVFWDAQNVMLEDIDRIEVISGPGGTLWGANAVNGVINVITKSARDTQGALVSGGGGSYLKGFGNGRYGGRIGDALYWRAYGMGFGHGNTLLPSGRDADDRWSMGQGGFRGDWAPSAGANVMVQGNFYDGQAAQAAPGDRNADGQNLIARWAQPLPGGSDFNVQMYWDRTRRQIPNSITEVLNIYDIELDHRFALGERNKFVWGGGYRFMHDDVKNPATFAFLPRRRDLHLVSGFLQDEIAVVRERLFLTLGSKFEHNSFSGFEFQPSVRLAWKAAPDQTIWAAVSRAVRTPSRIDSEVVIPATPPFFLVASRDKYQSEVVIAYELGYRAELAENLSLSIAGFYNNYDKIRAAQSTGIPGQFTILNPLEADAYGIELSLTWQATKWWRLRGGYTYLDKHIHLGNSADPNNGRGEGNDPHHQFLIQSMINLPQNVEVDSVLRYVDNLNQRGPLVPSYISLDLRLGWRPTANWEFAIVGQNLLDKRHPEFVTQSTNQEIPRSVYGKVTWKFWTGDDGAKSR